MTRALLGPLKHGVVLATTFLVFAWPLTNVAGRVAGVTGMLVGCVMAPVLMGARYRLSAVLVLAALWMAVGVVLGDVLVGVTSVARALGPWNAVEAGEVPRWAGLCAGVALALRALALRWRPALAVEGAAVVAAVASTVGAHRDGMIARPLSISDWFWTHGVDPVVAFLALGMAAAVLLGNVLAQQRSAARTAAQMALVLVLGFMVARHLHSQDTQLRAQSGGAGDDDEEKDRQERARQAMAGGQSGGNAKGQRLSDDVPPTPQGGKGRNRPVAVALFYRDVKPVNGIFYFRNTSFSQFNGVRLVQSTRPDADVDVRQAFPHAPVTLGDPPPDTSPLRQDVATDIALLTDHENVFLLTDALELSPLVNPDPARFRRAYHVVSSVVVGPGEDLLEHRAGSGTWSEELWAHYTAVPSDPRYLELARKLQAQLRAPYRKDPAGLALTVKNHLEETSIYSFAKRHDDAQDPTASFLFSEDRRGYCVHLAHSTALLLRALKVPARVSAGYAVPADRLGQGSSLLIKAENAHAWAEIYLRGVGWVPVEVTPEKSEVEQSSFVEQDLQQLLGEMARKGKRNAPPKEAPVQLGALWEALANGVPWVLLALLLAAYAVKAWRQVVPRFARAQLTRVAYRAALDELAAAGWTRHHGETRERFAARVASLAPSFAPLTDVHLAAAYGSRRPPPQHLAVAAAHVARELRRAQPGWRWALGLVNPVNWMWSR